MKPSNIRQVHERFGVELALNWNGEGENRAIIPSDTDESATSTAGPFNIIRPNRIQIIGPPEYRYLQSLAPSDYLTILQQLFSNAPAAIIFTDNLEPTPECLQSAKQTNTALMQTPLDGTKVISQLLNYFNQPQSATMLAHGVFLEVLGKGVLLRGDPAMGKSELALELISRGNRLISDDITEILRQPDNVLVGRPPPLLRDYLEVRGLGLINVRAMFGDSVIKPKKYLHLIIDLINLDQEQMQKIDRLSSMQSTTEILGVTVSQTTLPVAPGRNLAILVETAVRQYLLQVGGYDASEEFSRRQKQMMDNQSS
jgi:HPr kinase/phosphorylase